jgi:hypothetical protein
MKLFNFEKEENNWDEGELEAELEEGSWVLSN